MGKGKKNNADSKEQKREFIDNVSARLAQDPQSFLRLATYNDAKRWMRRVEGSTNKFVDNGQSFLHIMTESLRRTGNERLKTKFAELQAEHRAAKQTDNIAATTATVQPKIAPVATASSATANAAKPKKESSLEEAQRQLPPGHRIDVYYGKTDNERGYKEYTCVVVQTSQQELHYDRQEGLYFPDSGSQYKILYEVPPSQLKQVCGDLELNSGFVSPALRERILEYCRQQTAS